MKSDLVYAYKILAYLNLDDHTYTHLSTRSEDGDSFYIFPFGFRFDEVTEDTLMKVDFDGNVLEGKEYQHNITGYAIHSVIYKNRNDIESIFHLHTPEIVSVSSNQDGLLPLSQWALHFYGKVSYHDYNSLVLNKEQSQILINDLGENYTMMLRNHGSITCGHTIHEAMFYTYHLQQACKTQCLSSSILKEKLIIPEHEICKKSVDDLLTFEKDLGKRDWEAWKRLIDKKF